MADSGCIYGPTGAFKTTQIKFLSRYIYETTGKSTLLLSCDGGGWKSCGDEVSAGIILPYRVETATLPIVILRKISQGYWPQDPEETEPSRINLIPVDWTKVGGIGVEGWSSISQVLMRYLPDKGINVGGENRQKPDANMAFSVPIHVSGELVSESFGSNTRGDYGFVQNHLYGLVMNFNSLPVKYVLYTALEAKTEDDDKSTVYGPAIAGKKATAACGAWVGDLLHAQDYVIPRKVKVPDPTKPGELIDQDVFDIAVRLYFKRHLDPLTMIPYPAKPRVTPSQIAELEHRLPGGYFEPTTEWGFDRYLFTLDELGTKGAESLQAWRKKIDEKLGRGGNVAEMPRKAR
jgi:hypothetical protein